MSSLQSKSVWQDTEFRFFSQYWPGYWPSSRRKLRSIYAEKKKGGYSGYLNSTSLFNKGFIIWPLLLLLYITRTLGKAVLESALLQWNPAITDSFVCPARRKAYQDTFYAASHMFSYFIDPSTGTLVICALFIAG